MEIVKAFNSNNLHTDIVIKGTPDKPLFRASDIGNILEIVNIRQSISDFNEHEKVVSQTYTLGGNQNTTFLTTRGLYKLLFKSKKPIAETFQNWVCDVIEEIRLKGIYELEKKLQDGQHKIQEAEQKIKQAEETIQLLQEENEKNNEKIPSIYIYNTDTRMDKPELKIGYTINVQNRIRPYKQVCKHGRLEFSHQVYNKNIKVFENFIHNVLSDFLVKDEVFSIDVEEAKIILLRLINTVNVLKIQNKSERQLKLNKLLEYENFTINNVNNKISTNEISTQTEFDETKSELTNPIVEKNDEMILKFNKYIDECCIIRDDVEVSTQDIEGQFRIWSKIAKKYIYLAFNSYLKTRFKYVRLKQQCKNQLQYGYSGVKLKEIIYKKVLINSDEQNFIFHACTFSPGGKVLNSDLICEYAKWKNSLNKAIFEDDNERMKNYLRTTNYIIYTTIWTPSGNGQGYYGLQLNNQIDNVKKTSTTGKTVEKRHFATNELLGTWETIAKAAESEKMCSAKLSRSIKNKVIFNNDYYYTVENNK